jgi:hypothetical protein
LDPSDLEDVLFGLGVVELGGGDVEGDEDVLAEFVAGRLDRLGDDFERGLVGGEHRGEAAFVADGGGEALALRTFLRAWKTRHPCAGPRGRTSRRGA